MLSALGRYHRYIVHRHHSIIHLPFSSLAMTNCSDFVSRDKHRVTRGLPPLSLQRKTSNMQISTSVVQAIQQGLIDMQSFTSMPWYATIAASTVLVRLALLPLTRQHLISMHKFSKALPEISLLNELLKQSLSKNSLNTAYEKKEAIKNYMIGFKAALKLHNASFYPILALPLINLTIFITFIYAVRGLIVQPNIELGGTLWFEDLQDHDSTLILPLMAVCGTYTTLNLGFRSVEEGSIFVRIKDFLQTFVLICLPITAQLPAGVFCYWIPSSITILAQSLLLRQPAVLKLLKIPVPPKHSGFRMPDVKE